MANLKTLGEIFNNTLFRIPDYQRGYAWTAKDQLQDFWDDLYNLSADKNHYTGVLTIKTVDRNTIQSENWNDEKWIISDRGYKAYYVVDGQQRLTTAVVFIQALIELVKELPVHNGLNLTEIYLGSISLKEMYETYIVVNKPPEYIIKTYKFGYECDNPSFTFLRHRIFNEKNPGTINETFYTLNLENAKKFFIDKLKGVYEIEGLTGFLELYKKLTVNLKFNLYEIDDDFDVFVAFETMNNRGKKLSNLELLKNRLIYLTTLYNTDELKEDDRIALRKKIDNAWKEVYYQLGRNKNYPLNDDDFLVAHWIIYFQYSRQKGDDYIDFLLKDHFTPKNIFEKVEIPVLSTESFELITERETELDEDNSAENGSEVIVHPKLKPKDIEKYILSLQSAAVHWYNTWNPVNNSQLSREEQVWIDRLNRIGIAYFRPLITASFLNKKITKANRISLFIEIERFIFIAFRLGRAISTYRNSEFYRAARFLRTGEWNVDQIIGYLRQRIEFSFYSNEKSDDWFKIDYFKNYIEKHFKNGGGYYWWNGLRYFLYEYEMDLVNQRGSQKIDWNLFVKSEKDKVSIEHILPQTAENKYWKSVLKEFSPTQKTRLQNTLGNLLPLSQSINSSLQNDSFQNKKKAKYNDKKEIIRRGYNDGSHSEIEVSLKKEWTSKQILERGLKLLEFMERRWNIHFENKSKKIELLGLEFLKMRRTK